MAYDHGLKSGDTINNQQMMEIFKCSQQGGMRRSHATNTLLLISDHTKSLYEDLWQGDILHYVGMGTEGDQDINFQQNKTLANSNRNQVDLLLFEVFNPGQYTFMGPVEIAGQPYQTKQLDAKDNMRQVWVFPLKILNAGQRPALPESLVTNKQKRKEKRARLMSEAHLKAMIESSPQIAGTRPTTTVTYERNPYVAEYAKRRAKGKCQLCEQSAPFMDKERKPYLESHHILWLSKGGVDTIDNTVALCPNCHRKMHVAEEPKDIIKLFERVKVMM